MFLKVLFVLLTIRMCQSVEVIDFQNIQSSYEFLLNPGKFCINKKAVINTDKPVYKIGEKAIVTIFYYDLINKSPLSKCKDNKYFNIEVLDGQNKNVGFYNSETNEEKDKEIKDYSFFTLEVPIDDKFKGGVYKVKYNNQN